MIEVTKSDASRGGLLAWEQTFRAAAERDKNQALRAHLRRLGLPDAPDLLLEGTVAFVQLCAAYLLLDNQRVSEFLKQQRYDAEGMGDGFYVATFDIHGKGYARLVTQTSFPFVDLADLYGSPLEAYKVVGFAHFWITCRDEKDLSSDEIAAFEQEITSNLRFDYDEGELNVWFDPYSVQGALLTIVQDTDM